MSKPKKPNRKLQQERELRGWSQARLAEEIGTDEKRIGVWERGESRPSPFFQAKLCELFGKDAKELGFLGNFLEKGSTIVTTPDRSSPVPSATGINSDGYQTIQLFIPGTPQVVTIHIQPQAQVTTSVSSEENAIIDARMTTTLAQEYPRETEGTVKRREFFQEGLRTGAAILTSYDLINNELLDRFLKALKKPSTIDERTLNYFELRTEGYWQDRHSAALASSDLLSYVLEHLQRVITLLEVPLYPSIRVRLCNIASGIAQLAGHLLFDMGEFDRARNFHQTAVTAAREGENQALEAVAWGRMSFTWTYGGNQLEALRCIQQARRLAEGNVNTTVRAYLAAVEAEIQAILGDSETCLKALDIAEQVEDRQHPREETYWLRFDRSRFVGYRGTCFRRLYNPANVRTHSFLDEAQKSLTDALALLDPKKIQRRPALLIDIASTYAQQGDVEGAYENAILSLSTLTQIKSQTLAKRLFSLRQELEPWKDTQHVKNLDQQMASLIKFGEHRGIA